MDYRKNTLKVLLLVLALSSASIQAAPLESDPIYKVVHNAATNLYSKDYILGVSIVPGTDFWMFKTAAHTFGYTDANASFIIDTGSKMQMQMVMKTSRGWGKVPQITRKPDLSNTVEAELLKKASKFGISSFLYLAHIPGTPIWMFKDNDGDWVYTDESMSFLMFMDEELTNNPIYFYEVVDGNKLRDLTSKGEAYPIAEELKNITNTIDYPAKNETYQLFVFTDPLCQYCIKLHKQIKEYNKRGITIRYVAKPTLGPDAVEIMENVWSASPDKRPSVFDFAIKDVANGYMPDWNEVGVKKSKSGIEAVSAHDKMINKLHISSSPGLYTPKGNKITNNGPDFVLEALQAGL